MLHIISLYNVLIKTTARSFKEDQALTLGLSCMLNDRKQWIRKLKPQKRTKKCQQKCHVFISRINNAHWWRKNRLWRCPFQHRCSLRDHVYKFEGISQVITKEVFEYHWSLHVKQWGKHLQNKVALTSRAGTREIVNNFIEL